MNKYSPSKLNVWTDCKRKYKYKYVDKIKVPFIPKPFFEKGTFYHQVLEFYPNKLPEPFNFKLSSKDDIKRYKLNLIDILKNNQIKRLLDISHISELKINYKDSEINFGGYIDYISISSKKAIIVDWKTGKIYKDKTDHQIKLYALWVFLHHSEIEVVKSGYYYLEHSKPVFIEYYRKDLEVIKQYFINTVNDIETCEDFTKSPHHNCDWCDFNNLCKPFQMENSWRKEK